jgi:hypothetical protein
VIAVARQSRLIVGEWVTAAFDAPGMQAMANILPEASRYCTDGAAAGQRFVQESGDGRNLGRLPPLSPPARRPLPCPRTSPHKPGTLKYNAKHSPSCQQTC